MPYEKHDSGLIIYRQAPSQKKFICPYELDDRVDRDLANLTQRLYRSIQAFLGDQVQIAVGMRQGVRRESFPNAVQVWVIYCAALIQGAADAALTAILHNLGRDARSLVRQIFEYSAKAAYFCSHPRAAKRELETEPFRELRLLQELGYDRRRVRYRRLKQECGELSQKRPTLAAYAEKTERRESPTVKKTLGKAGRRSTEAYAFHYRIASQTIHAGVLGMRDVISDDGIKFDSREADPNVALRLICVYLLTFLRLLDSVFALKRGKELMELEAEYRRIAKALQKPSRIGSRRR